MMIIFDTDIKVKVLIVCFSEGRWMMRFIIFHLQIVCTLEVKKDPSLFLSPLENIV